MHDVEIRSKRKTIGSLRLPKLSLFITPRRYLHTSRSLFAHSIFLLLGKQMTHRWFSLEAFLLAIYLSLSASAFYQKPTKQLSRTLFKSSLLYLPLWLVAMVFHRRSESQHVTWNQVKSEFGKLPNFRLPSSKLDFDASNRPQPTFAPFPFVPLPLAEMPLSYLWEGLDDVIQEQKQAVV